MQLNVMRASTVSKALHAPMICYRYEQMLYDILLFELRPGLVSYFAGDAARANERRLSARSSRWPSGQAVGGSGACQHSGSLSDKVLLLKLVSQFWVTGTW